MTARKDTYTRAEVNRLEDRARARGYQLARDEYDKRLEVVITSVVACRELLDRSDSD